MLGATVGGGSAHPRRRLRRRAPTAMREERAAGPRLFRVILPVADIERAARFYGRVLGTAGRRVSPGRHYFDCGGTILACFDPRSDGDGYEPSPNPEHLYFAVADLDATFEAARAAGARFPPGAIHGDRAGGIALRPWGERSFYADDPFGNRLCFVDAATTFTGAGAPDPGRV